jgi:hypothetical protein
LNHDVRPRPTVLWVWALECVFEILQRPSFIIHYLVERARLQRTIDVDGDELDWLGLYLESGFNFAGIEAEPTRLMIGGMSKPVDDYFIAVDAGLAPKKPAPKLAKLWMNVLIHFEKRRFAGWVEVALDLLRAASLEEQKRVEREFNRLCGSVSRNWRDPKHICAIIVTPPPIREAAVVFYAFPPKLAHARKERADNLAASVFNESACRRCVIIGKQIGHADPYSFLAVYRSPTEENTASSYNATGGTLA